MHPFPLAMYEEELMLAKKNVGGRRGEGVLLKERMETLLYEGGGAAPRILELLLGFWSKM